MDNQQVKNAVRKFSILIERNKDHRAYSDFKEGMNQGLEMAKDTFDENAEKFFLSDSDEDRATKIKSLQDKFDLLIDTLDIVKKPKYTQDSLDGINKGLERSKELFRDFIEDLYKVD